MKHLLLAAALLTSGSAFAASCPVYDYDLLSATGTSVAMGNTCGMVNDDTATCGGSANSEDVSYLWTAPASGDVYVSLAGSNYDSVIHIKDAGCTEIICNDDGATGLQSYAMFTATAGTTYNIFVDGYNTTACGDYELSITATMGDYDGDGVTDDLDQCYGDDATGDTDYDYLCNDIDPVFTLNAAFAGAGQPLTLTATNAPAGQAVYFLASSAYGYVCHPSGLACVDMAHPRVLGSSVANGAGTATITINAPAVLPPSIYFQSAWIDAGAGLGDASNLLSY